MTILLHSSKTMRQPKPEQPLQTPHLIKKATELATYIQTMTSDQLQQVMRISPGLAQKTQATFNAWNTDASEQSAAIDSFVGDIYSGLRAAELSEADRAYAQDHLRILSGLYGLLQPLDGIMPYRLELMYSLPSQKYKNLYTFWGEDVAALLPHTGVILNLAANEYSKLVLPYVEPSRVVTPRFLTVNPKTHEPSFVVVHAKIARGAFARWAIVNRVTSLEQLSAFDDIGYHYDPALSTPAEPVFVCQEFGGKGLSMRLA